MNWKVKNWRTYEKNTLQGFFDLEIGPMTIKGFTYHFKNGKSWAAFPGRPELKNGQPIMKNGKVKHFPMVFIEKDKLSDFQRWVCDQIKPFLNPAPEPEPDDIYF
jgi:hypothetical protein